MLFIRTYRISISILLILATTLSHSQDNHEWKLVKKSNGIEAFVKSQDDTKIKRVKVETIVTGTLSELVSIIKDAENHPQWVFMNKEAKILDTVNCYRWKYYGYSDLPWPISDRDFVTDVILNQDSIDYSITIVSTAIPEYIPELENCLRIQTVYSQWILNPLGNGEVHMSFELSIDIGGKIPVWFINMAVAKGPFHTMEGLIEQLKKSCYKDSKLDSIKEL